MIVHSSNRAEWLKARRASIGGSDAPAVCGISKWNSRLGVWADKRGITEETKHEEWHEIGLQLEPVIGSLVAWKSGRKLVTLPKYAVIRSDVHEFVGCTPDFLVVDKEKGLGVLQTKNVAARNAWEWIGESEPPAPVLVQNQHELIACSSCDELIEEYGEPKYGMVGALLGGGEVVWYDQEPNDAFSNWLLTEEAKLWGMIQSGERPDPEGTGKCADVLRALYTKKPGGVIDLGDDALVLAAEYDEAKRNAKEWKDNLEEAKQKIAALIGENKRANLPDGTGFSNPLIPGGQVNPKPYTKKAYRRLTRVGLKKGA